MRLDKYLVDQGLCTSRERAQDAIKLKTVSVNGKIEAKASKDITDTDEVALIDIFNKYVSRGGLKLEKAIEVFNLDFQDRQVLDVGSSTGGFTDCALQHGADFVVAVDVGTDQLHESLRPHDKVLSIENKDFRELTLEDVHDRRFDWIVSDVSFISLTYLFPYFKTFMKPDAQLMLLIKPQFEAGQSFLNRSGIVTDEKGYKVAIQKVMAQATIDGFYLNNIAVSTLFEKNKNVEFLALFSTKDTGFRYKFDTLAEEIKRMKQLVN
jgi:23S rRNA (cytidine1920-2'-O)/16S rRNA (cytidine1409-2'-O)-methyltransferase